MTKPGLIDLLPEDLKPKTVAETELIEAAQKGKCVDCRTGDTETDKPQNSGRWGAERNIRAELLSWLCSDAEAAKIVHHRGIQVIGARVTGKVDLSFATLPYPLGLFNCVINDGIILQHADIHSLNFSGSHTGYIDADGLKVKGDVFLNDGFHAKGEVRLLRADIGGDLTCRGGIFENKKGYALSADGLKVKGNVFLNDGFHARGEVRLIGADIGGNLDCSGGIFENEKGDALDAEGINVKGVFFWQTKGKPKGTIDLAHARVGQLVDNKESWPDKDKLFLDGFEYRAFAGDNTPISAKERLEWLRLQPQKPFKPQPYEHLAKVLRQMGHEKDAIEVLIEKQEDLRKHSELGRGGRFWNRFLGETIGHGWKPGRALGIIFFIFAIGMFFFSLAENFHIMQPTKKYISPLPYPDFSPFIYSLDTLIPFINLHQEDYYLPDASRPWGWFFRGYLIFHIFLGWFFSTLTALSVTGLVRKK